MNTAHATRCNRERARQRECRARKQNGFLGGGEDLVASVPLGAFGELTCRQMDF